MQLIWSAAVVVPQKLITWSRFLYENQTVARLVHFIAFCGAQRFITMFTRAAYKSMPWGFQEVEAPRFHDGQHMKVVRLSAVCTSCLYTQEIFLVLISVRGRVNPRAVVWPEGLCRWKIPMTLSGIKSMTLQLVAECVNQLWHCVPQEQLITVLIVTSGSRPHLNILFVCKIHPNITLSCMLRVSKWSLSPRFFNQTCVTLLLCLLHGQTSRPSCSYRWGNGFSCTR